MRFYACMHYLCLEGCLRKTNGPSIAFEINIKKEALYSPRFEYQVKVFFLVWLLARGCPRIPVTEWSEESERDRKIVDHSLMGVWPIGNWFLLRAFHPLSITNCRNLINIFAETWQIFITFTDHATNQTLSIKSCLLEVIFCCLICGLFSTLYLQRSSPMYPLSKF